MEWSCIWGELSDQHHLTLPICLPIAHRAHRRGVFPISLCELGRRYFIPKAEPFESDRHNPARSFSFSPGWQVKHASTLCLPAPSRPPLTIMSLLQSSESRLYTFSQETKDKLRKFRLGTSRAKDPQAVICKGSTDFEYNLTTEAGC